MKSQVFFADLRVPSGETLLDKLDRLLDHTRLNEKVQQKALVAIKLHFGEKGNTGYVRPIFLKRVVDYVKRWKGKAFLTDSNTLYPGSRMEAISHLTLAHEHGFAFSVVGAPLIIADGLRGNSGVRVRIDQPIFETVSIAEAIHLADVLVTVTHFTGHELSGFGGTLKNLGMGCATRQGKLSQHSNLSPKVKGKTCTGCELCIRWCPEGAIELVSRDSRSDEKGRVARIHPEKCIGCGECISICPTASVQIQWNESIPLFQKKMVEYAYGALQGKRQRSLHLSFLMQISPSCDCNRFSETPLVNDIGILSSEDPVAIDQASVDLVNQEAGNRSSKLPSHFEPGEDKFRALYPQVDWSIQLSYAEEIGLGRREYELIKV